MKKAITYKDLLTINSKIQNTTDETQLAALSEERAEMERVYTYTEQNRLLAEMDDLMLAIRLLPADIVRARSLKPQTDVKMRSFLIKNDVECGRGLSQREIKYQAFVNRLSLSQWARVNRVYPLAVSSGLITETDDHCKWNLTKVALGYFIRKLLCPNEVKTEKIPFKSIEGLFGVRRLGRAIDESLNPNEKYTSVIDPILNIV